MYSFDGTAVHKATKKHISGVFFVLFFFCPQESEGFFLRALQINPNTASFHGNLGELLQL